MQNKKAKKGFKSVKSLFGKYDEIPEFWEIDKLKKILEIPVTDGPHSTPEFLEKGIPFISAEAIKNNKIDFKYAKFISQEDYTEFSKKSKAQKNDLLLIKAGNTTGKIAQVEVDFDFGIWSPLGLIRINEKNHHRFYYYLFQSHWFQKQIVANFHTTTQPNIGMKQIQKLLVIIPSKPEQEKIALILSNVDSLIDQTEKEIEQTEKLKRGLMQKFFTKGIGDKKFKTEKWLFRKEIKIPKEWERKTLLKTSKEGLRNGIFKKADEFGSGVPLINVTDLFSETEIQSNTLEKVSVSEKELKQFGVELGDIFFCRSSLVEEGIGQSNIILKLEEPSVFECHVMMLRINKSINPKFLFYYTRSHLFKQFLTSIAMTLTMTTIKQPDLEMAPILLPSIDEQNQIALILTGIDNRILVLESDKSELEKLKKGLMQKLLTGETRVKV